MPTDNAPVLHASQIPENKERVIFIIARHTSYKSNSIIQSTHFDRNHHFDAELRTAFI